MSKYMTRQRKLLTAFLSEHADEPVSAQEIEEALGGGHMSLSAVYRNLAELEAEGKLRRRTLGGAREVFYQYIDGEECRSAIHLSCKKCGRTFHMEPSEADELADALKKLEGFELSRGESVLYGVCAGCGDKPQGTHEEDKNAADNL